MKLTAARILYFLLAFSFSSCGNLFPNEKKTIKTITVLQYQGDELLGTSVQTFDGTGKKISEYFCQKDGKFSSMEKYLYNEKGLLIESRQNDSTMRSRIFFNYSDTMKISQEEFDEFFQDAKEDSIIGFFSKTESQLLDEKGYSVNTTYSYEDGKLVTSEADGVTNGEAAVLLTRYFYSDDGKKRTEITKIKGGLSDGKKTEEVNYEHSGDGKTITETHDTFGPKTYTYSIVYRYNAEGLLLTKEFKSKNEVWQKHIFEYEYYK